VFLGNPNIVGRDGSVPMEVCLVPLINKDPLLHFTHSMKVCYLNCVRILLQHGANPNCSFRSNLTPLHVLIFTVSENFTTNCDVQKRADFDFVKNLLLLLLQHGLDCNATKQNILQSVIEMIQNIRKGQDIVCVYELTLMLLQYGADPNYGLSNKVPSLPPFTAMGATASTSAGTGTNGAGASGGATNGLANATGATNTDFTSSQRHNPRNTILFYATMLIVRKDHLILTDPDLSYHRLIYLLYFSMRHDTLYRVMKSLHNLFITQVPNKSIENLIVLISTLYKTPRSLKQLCRVKIYNSVNRRLAQNINSLNLPASLKEYVLNFDF
jgi:SOCS box